MRVYSASANMADWHILRGTNFVLRLFFQLLKPKYGIGVLTPRDRTLGSDLSGRVEAVGDSVKEFHPGDDVFGFARGSFAEYVSVPESHLALKPRNVTFEEAAAVPLAATTALQYLRDRAHVGPGQKVLINGASGGVGTFAVEIGKLLGAEVTAVCSTRSLDTARSIGADHVIDYSQVDFTRAIQRYDCIVAANGYHSIIGYRRALSPGGVFIQMGASLRAILQVSLLGPLVSRIGNRKILPISVARRNKEDLVRLKELLEEGRLKPVIDRRFALDEVSEAMGYLGEGHAVGKVIIIMGEGGAR